MGNEHVHITDPELLQFLDGELQGSRISAVNAHLAACWACRTQRARMELKIAEFMEARNARIDLPPAAGPRNTLEVRMARLAATATSETRAPSRQWTATIRRPAYAGTLILAALAVGMLIHFRIPGVHAASIPNARLTPGVVRAVSREDLCAASDADDRHPVPNGLAIRVFDKYGIRNPQPRTYEVDYLITPALGGSDDEGNLWPEPYTDGVWNAHVKDALEDRLHEMVCSGKMDLPTAQHDIATNWIEAYKRYFHTDVPLELHASFSKDPPWE
jgi:hypothetical protein